MQKADISYVNAGRVVSQSSRRQRISQNADTRQGGAALGLSLQSLLAGYTREVAAASARATTYSEDGTKQNLETSLLSDASAQAYLHSRGYDAADVVSWHSILTTKDDIAAFEEILSNAEAVQEATSHGAQRRVPNFVFLFSLRRSRLSPEALRCALSYASYLLQPDKYDTPSLVDAARDATISDIKTSRMALLDESTQLIIIIRLLRFARMVLPQALIDITRLFGETISDVCATVTTLRQTTRRHRLETRLTLYCNRILSLLSLPCSIHPYLNASVQQTAQFDLLQKMAEQRPMVPVTRLGYQAIARVQLASKKTAQESDWASLKVKTWPPWKEDKIGFDAEKGPEYGVSRALHAIGHARQAGYGSGRWEQVAQILSGWDVDNSPTIQTRAWLLSKSIRRRGRNHAADRWLWIARIRATRTVQEAWACFLAYQDRQLPPHQDIFLEIFRKLHAEHIRTRRPNVYHTQFLENQHDPLHGGDAKEPLPTSLSQKEGVYVRSPVPSLDDLVKQMRKQGILPTGKCLAFLVTNAASLRNGIKYMAWSGAVDPGVRGPLMSTSKNDPHFSDMSLETFNAFIQLLCRCHYSSVSIDCSEHTAHIGSAQEDHIQLTTVNIKDPVIHALSLMEARSPKYAPSWHALLGSLVSVQLSGLTKDATNAPAEGHDIERWRLSQHVRRKMKDAGLNIDFESFRLLCRTLEKASLAALQIQTRSKRGPRGGHGEASPISAELSSSAQKLTSTSFSYIRRLFYELFGTPDARSMVHLQHQCRKDASGDSEVKSDSHNHSVPILLATPEPAVLHFYVRVVGLLSHHHGLLELVRWMVVYQSEISAAADRPRNGHRMLRRTLVAIRVFSEQLWLDHGKVGQIRDSQKSPAGHASEGAAPAKTLEKIRELVEGVEEWGGWPTDEEAEEYCQGRLTSMLMELEHS